MEYYDEFQHFSHKESIRFWYKQAKSRMVWHCDFWKHEGFWEFHSERWVHQSWNITLEWKQSLQCVIHFLLLARKCEARPGTQRLRLGSSVWICRCMRSNNSFWVDSWSIDPKKNTKHFITSKRWLSEKKGGFQKTKVDFRKKRWISEKKRWILEKKGGFPFNSPWKAGNTVGMLKVEAERTRENVRCQAEVENEPDKLTNYW